MDFFYKSSKKITRKYNAILQPQTAGKWPPPQLAPITKMRMRADNTPDKAVHAHSRGRPSLVPVMPVGRGAGATQSRWGGGGWSRCKPAPEKALCSLSEEPYSRHLRPGVTWVVRVEKSTLRGSDPSKCTVEFLTQNWTQPMEGV